jgi:ribonuclease HI
MSRTQTAQLVVYADGASLGNPGPAGAGFVIATPDGAVLRRRCLPLGQATNNVAEYRAVIAALHEAAALGAQEVVVRADSELIIKQMRGEYSVRSKHLRPLYEWARKVARRFQKVHWEQVGREENAAADALAKAGAARSAQKISPAPG